jgi:hypothetical protein
VFARGFGLRAFSSSWDFAPASPGLFLGRLRPALALRSSNAWRRVLTCCCGSWSPPSWRSCSSGGDHLHDAQPTFMPGLRPSQTRQEPPASDRRFSAKSSVTEDSASVLRRPSRPSKAYFARLDFERPTTDRIRFSVNSSVAEELAIGDWRRAPPCSRAACSPGAGYLVSARDPGAGGVFLTIRRASSNWHISPEARFPTGPTTVVDPAYFASRRSTSICVTRRGRRGRTRPTRSSPRSRERKIR